MRRVTNRRVRSSGVGGELNVLLNSASKVALRSKKASVLSSSSCMRIDVGDYVHGVLLRQALRGERDLKVDILRRDDGQSQGHQCVEEIVTIVAIEGGGHHRAWARRLKAYVKVVCELLDDGELVEETDEDLVEQEYEAVVQAAPLPGGLKQYYLETFLGAGPQAGIVDHLA